MTPSRIRTSLGGVTTLLVLAMQGCGDDVGPAPTLPLFSSLQLDTALQVGSPDGDDWEEDSGDV